HIRNGDVRMMVVAVIIAGVVGFFAELIFRLWFNTGFGMRRSRSSDEDRGKGGNMIAIVIAVVLIAVAWLLSVMIRFALSRSREFLADAGSVEQRAAARRAVGRAGEPVRCADASASASASAPAPAASERFPVPTRPAAGLARRQPSARSSQARTMGLA